jgi:hypothetical protein
VPYSRARRHVSSSLHSCHRRARAPPHQTVRGSRQEAPPDDDGPKTNRSPRGRAPQKRIHLHGRRTRSSYRHTPTSVRSVWSPETSGAERWSPPIGRTSPLLVSVDLHHAGKGWIYARGVRARRHHVRWCRARYHQHGTVETISPAVTAASRRYAWPDGVKELNNKPLTDGEADRAAEGINIGEAFFYARRRS